MIPCRDLFAVDLHTAYADIYSYVNFTDGASGILTCNTSETRVNWVRHLPTKKQISYQNQLLPSEPGKYVLDGLKLTVNNVSKQDADEYHCETPDYHHLFFVAVQLQSKNVFNTFQIAIISCLQKHLVMLRNFTFSFAYFSFEIRFEFFGVLKSRPKSG